MRITLLVDNTAKENFAAEFGLAMLLEREGRTILFDTGAGTAMAGNLKAAGTAPETVKEVILSHGHFDHTGGLAQLAPQRIFCSPRITDGHFSLHDDGSVYDITMPLASKAVLEKTECCFISEFTDIGSGMMLSGKVPRVSGEDCGGNFFHDRQCSVVDNICNEQFLLTSDGILVSGCCHAGIINSITHAKNIHPDISVHTVIGGLHLCHADKKRLKETADFLVKSKIKQLFLLHCTGEEAIRELRFLLPECSIHTPVAGDVIDL